MAVIQSHDDSHAPALWLEVWLILPLVAVYCFGAAAVVDAFQLTWFTVTHYYIPSFLLLGLPLTCLALFGCAWRYRRAQLAAGLRASLRWVWLAVPVGYFVSLVGVWAGGSRFLLAVCSVFALLTVASTAYLCARLVLVAGVTPWRLALAGFIQLAAEVYFFADSSWFVISRGHLGVTELWFLIHPHGLETGLDVDRFTVARYAIILCLLSVLTFWPFFSRRWWRQGGRCHVRAGPVLGYAVLMLGCQQALWLFPPSVHGLQELRLALPFSLVVVDTRPAPARALQRLLDEHPVDEDLYTRMDRIQRSYPDSELKVSEDRRWHVFIVCIESLRFDAIDVQRMPRLASFAQRAERWSPHYSSCSGSATSVFSLVQGVLPMHRHAFARDGVGSLLGRILKGAGYQLHAFALSVLRYRFWAETIFRDFTLHERAGVTDVEVAASLIEVFESVRATGQPFASYWHVNAPHYSYRFEPQDVRHRPFLDVRGGVSPTFLRAHVDELRNRYLNALVHADRAVGVLLDHLESSGQLDRSIVVVTGDHGEEFLEDGHLFHGHASNRWQDEVPLLYWHPGLGRDGAERRGRSYTQHSDVAAEILSYLCGETVQPLGTARSGDHHEFAIGTMGYSERVWYRDRQFPSVIVVGKLTRRGLFIIDVKGGAALAAGELERLATRLARHLEVAFPRLAQR